LSKGASTEALFDFHAIERGMVVSRPLYDIGYDRIVDRKGKLTRVQIKMTGYKQGNQYLVHTGGTKMRRYVDEFDVLAIYIKPACVWMFLPFEAITSATMKVSINGKAKRYINNWEIFYAEK